MISGHVEALGSIEDDTSVRVRCAETVRPMRMIVGSVVSKNLEGPDRSFAVFVLGYLAIFVGWYWWTLRSDDPISAVAFVLPLSLLNSLLSWRLSWRCG